MHCIKIKRAKLWLIFVCVLSSVWAFISISNIVVFLFTEMLILQSGMIQMSSCLKFKEFEFCLMIWYGFPGLWTECLWFTWNLIILNSDKFIHFCTYCFELGPKCESDVLMSHYLSSITLQLEGASLCNEWFGILWSYLVWIGKNNYCISITISIKVQYKCFICVIQVTASEPCSSNTISTEKK